MVAEFAKPIKIFYSYAHEDSNLRTQLEKHLSPLRRLRRITGWFDRDIQVGNERSHEIEKHLEEADIILLLVSPDFIASDYCYGVEMSQALKRHRDGKAHIIPIILRPVNWQATPLSGLQVLPSNELPITSWSDLDQALLDVARGIEQLIKTLLEKQIGSEKQKHILLSELVDQLRLAQPHSLSPYSDKPSGDANTNFPPEEKKVLPDQIITPCLMIFLGGSAALSSLELLQHMLVLSPSDRHRVAFVYFDTDDMPTSLLNFRKQYGHLFRLFSLRISIPHGLSTMQQIDTNDQHMFIRDVIPQYFTHGTNRVRNNAHVAACFHQRHIYDLLESALVSITRVDTSEEINLRRREVQANIIASLGGGTGSGFLPDIAVIVRDLLMIWQCVQRLNIFGILPEQLQGVDLGELRWLKSNATACLLELVAFSCAASGTPDDSYQKKMRKKTYRLTSDPIANEVYLFEHKSLASVENVLRSVGLDLFHRVTDASGVGFLEHSKWVDRRTLGETDDRDIPTMFGTTCSFEVRFPMLETAKVFAQISAARLLPLLRGLEFWFQRTEIEQYSKELEQQAKESKTWQGQLEHPHPHQYHIFDLDVFSKDHQNLAMHLLYLSSTGTPGSRIIDYSIFIGNCIEYLAREVASLEGGNNWKQLDLDEFIARRLVDYIIGFFYDYYVKQFSQLNLFELLEKVTFLNENRLSKTEQINSFFSAHLENIRQQINPPISFEPELWHHGLDNLDTSFYVGMHWRNPYQYIIFEQALEDSGFSTHWGQRPAKLESQSYHSLQISYGLHAISLSTIKDLYHDDNESAMEAYLFYQSQWEKAGTAKPLHSSGEAEKLIQKKSLPSQVIRKNFVS